MSRLQSLPGVAGATPVLLRPFTGNDGWDATVSADGQSPEAASANPGLQFEAVLPIASPPWGFLRRKEYTGWSEKGVNQLIVRAKLLARCL